MVLLGKAESSQATVPWARIPRLIAAQDVAFYGLGLNNTVILTAIGWGAGTTVYQTYYNMAIGNMILVAGGAVPGYWVSAALIDTIGRKPIQMFGFAALTLLFLVIGFQYWYLSPNMLLLLYTLAMFFFNAGPNSTTFIVPAECFPTKYRSTAHGISAASGKLGAIISQLIFGPLKTRPDSFVAPKGDSRLSAPWLGHIMQIFAGFMFLGFLTTFLIPETKRKTLEELGGLDGDNDEVTQVTQLPHSDKGSRVS